MLYLYLETIYFNIVFCPKLNFMPIDYILPPLYE